MSGASTEPCWCRQILGLAGRVHGRRVNDFVCATVTELEYSITTTVLFFDDLLSLSLSLSFTVFFFDDWGRDEDPRWFGSEHSLGLVVTTKPPH